MSGRIEASEVGLANNLEERFRLAPRKIHLENLEIALERVSDQDGVVVEQLRQILLHVL